VAYVIRPQAGLPTGTEIRNIGFISFDPLAGGATFRTDLVDPTNPNSGIDTNRQALVTIDADIPAGSITALPANSTSEDFTVAWSGNDAGAGVANYDIYVQTDGGDWVQWLNNTPLTSATWNGAAGRRYGFYAVAIDGAGLSGTSPSIGTAPQTATTISTSKANFFRVLTISAEIVDLEFAGTPGEVWTIQRAPSITGPWQNLDSFTINADGTAPLTDHAPISGTAFYRAIR
jgi:hypothetical protein